jgi:hypothetical protein
MRCSTLEPCYTARDTQKPIAAHSPTCRKYQWRESHFVSHSHRFIALPFVRHRFLPSLLLPWLDCRSTSKSPTQSRS